VSAAASVILGGMAARNGKSGANGHDADEDLARQALRDVLSSKKAGTRVKTSAALTLLRATGAVRARDGEVQVDEDAPDPMRDLDLMERARQLQLRGRRSGEWNRAWLMYEEGVLSLDDLEALLDKLGG
jgi:hypothetical protein